MSADLTSYLPLIVIGLVVLALVVWILAQGGRKARVVKEEGAPAIGRDVLDEGAAPAQRNQALIDAPRKSAAGIEPVSAAPNAQMTAAAPLGTKDETNRPVIRTEAEPVSATESGDDLTRIKGLGPKIATLLGEFGITSFAQIAAWDESDIERIDAKLGRFSGRITRDQWVAQAKLLAAGDQKGFAERFGKNGKD